MNANANVADQHSARPELDRQVEGIGWALSLLMIGGIGLVENVPQDTWLIGTRLSMLSVNFVRQINGIPLIHFTLVLGVLALRLGLGSLTDVDIPFFPVLLIIIGAESLFASFSRSQTAWRMATQWSRECRAYRNEFADFAETS